MLQEVLVEEKYCPTHCVAMGTEDWAGNVLFSDPSPLSSTHTINWDGTIVIGDNDIGRLNSHMEIDQLQIIDNNAIRPERELIEEEISHPSGQNIENVLDVEFQREDAASEMKFVDFNTLIGKVCIFDDILNTCWIYGSYVFIILNFLLSRLWSYLKTRMWKNIVRKMKMKTERTHVVHAVSNMALMNSGFSVTFVRGGSMGNV
jgi:RNA polymerase subunit RPABC4/transcription elongation factor Spt4